MGRETKKQEKRQRLLDSAYDCITRRGLSGTTISEIARKAGVAKGTFYLYFNDKDDIARSLNKRITFELIQEAYAYTLEHLSDQLGDNLWTMADYTIGRFEKDPELIKVIKHDFIWPISEADLYSEVGSDLIPGYLQISEYAHAMRRPVKEILSVIYCIVCMLVSVCYDAIIEQNPASMHVMRPVLKNIILTLVPPSPTVQPI